MDAIWSAVIGLIVGLVSARPPENENRTRDFFRPGVAGIVGAIFNYALIAIIGSHSLHDIATEFLALWSSPLGAIVAIAIYRLFFANS